jgi:hypothetical protein
MADAAQYRSAMLTTELIRARDADRALYQPLSAALWSADHAGRAPSLADARAYLDKAKALAVALEREGIALMPLFAMED